MTPKIRWQAADPFAGFTLHAHATFQTSDHRWRNNDGSQTAATWIAAVNTSVQRGLMDPLRLRMVISEVGGADATISAQLQARLNGGAWQSVQVGGTGFVRIVGSTHFTNGTGTTRQIAPSGTSFWTGRMVDNESPSSLTLGGNSNTEIEWNLVGAQAGTMEFRVLIDGAVVTATSTPTVEILPPPSTAPQNLSLTSKSDTHIHFAWDYLGEAFTHFDVERNGIVVAQPSVRELNNGGLSPSTEYTYRVRAVNDSGDGPWSDPFVVTTDDPPPPPTGLAATVVDGSVELTWDDEPDVSFRLERQRDDSGSWVESTLLGPASSPPLLDDGMGDGRFRYRIQSTRPPEPGEADFDLADIAGYHGEGSGADDGESGVPAADFYPAWRRFGPRLADEDTGYWRWDAEGIHDDTANYSQMGLLLDTNETFAEFDIITMIRTGVTGQFSLAGGLLAGVTGRWYGKSSEGGDADGYLARLAPSGGLEIGRFFSHFDGNYERRTTQHGYLGWGDLGRAWVADTWYWLRFRGYWLDPGNMIRLQASLWEPGQDQYDHPHAQEGVGTHHDDPSTISGWGGGLDGWMVSWDFDGQDDLGTQRPLPPPGRNGLFFQSHPNTWRHFKMGAP